jgi:DNA-binding GntR family transcriptional regulator
MAPDAGVARPDGTAVAHAAPLQRHVLAEDVYEAVKAMVMDHVIEPGARMSIDGIARILGVSPTPIREALARLESDGLVVKQALRGYSTTPLLGAAELADLFQLRHLLEPWGAAQAASRMNDSARQAIDAELATCLDIPDNATQYEAYKALAAHDARFHDLVLALAGNEAVRAAFERTHCHLHLFRLFYASGIGGEALREHHEIARALVSGDPDAAAAAMTTHLHASEQRLRGAAQ